MTFNFPYRTQLDPDLWALVPLNDGRALWHAVEYEKTATTVSSITWKLRSYRAAFDMGKGHHLLMVCESQQVAERYDKLGHDLPMCVGVYGDVLTQPFHGTGSAWSRGGAPADIDGAHGVPSWSQQTQANSRYILVERTDLQL